MSSIRFPVRLLVVAIVTAGISPGQTCSWNDLPRFTPSPQVTDPQIVTMKVFDDGSGPALFVGGYFVAAGGVPASYIARWNGSSFAPVGGGVDGVVSALEVFDDGSGPALYAAGGFTTAGGVATLGIARWNGVAWTAVGGGLSGVSHGGARVLEVFDDGSGPALYAAGPFTSAGGQPANGIARWDGVSWTPLAPGLNGDIYAMAVFDDGTGRALYFGGVCGLYGSGTFGLARWTASGWSVFGGLGTVSYPGVFALEVYDDGTGPALYVGGHFTTIGLPMISIPALNVARWNGSWSAVGPGVPGVVEAFEAFDDGTGLALYEMGSSAPAYVGGWDGAAWGPVGSGTPFFQGDLEVFDDGSGPALFGGGRNVQGTGWMFGRYACGPGRLSLTMTQAGGPGAPCFVANANLTPGREIYNVFSLDLAPGGPGTGPPWLLGLSITTPANLDFVLDQLTAPLGTPFHFTAPASYVLWGPFPLAPVTVDAVTFELIDGAIGNTSIPVRLTVH
jgi:hypothetical protein